MAITKKLIHFNEFSNFNTQKLSANRENTAYTIGVGGAVTAGEPYILFHSIVFIKDMLKIWTHGSLYDCGETDLSEYLTADEIAEVYATIDALSSKQDEIEDLDTIRSGAALGATALQEHQDLSGKQDVLASGINIKTINGESILGEGDLEVGGGSAEIPIVDHGTNDTTLALTPNVFHKWGTVTSLTLTLDTPADTTVYNEYMFEFVSGSTATTLSLPSTVKWVSEPNIEADKTYQCSIVNNIGIIIAV